MRLIGQWVLVHVGFAVDIGSERRAKATGRNALRRVDTTSPARDRQSPLLSLYNRCIIVIYRLWGETSNRFLRQLLSAGVAFYWPLMSQAARTFTDQLGRGHGSRHRRQVVVLRHQTLNLLVQMNATDKIVGVMAGDGGGRRLYARAAGTGAKSTRWSDHNAR